MMIPVWAKNYIRPEKVDIIITAIKKTELRTSGEIIPILVRKSSTIGHVPLIVASILIIIILAIDLLTLQMAYLDMYYFWCIVNLVLAVGLTAMLSRFDCIRRLVTNSSDQASQVEMRAEVEFFEAGVRNTKDATGILLFVSLLERRAVVLADKAIADKVPASTWSEVCDLLVSGCKTKEIEAAFANAILKCGDILADHFPRQHDDKNELSDRLIIKD